MVRNLSRFGRTLLRGIGKTETDIAKGPANLILIAAHPELVHQPPKELEVCSLKQQDIELVLMNLPPLNADSYLAWVSEKDVATEKSILSWLLVARTLHCRRRPDFNALICRGGIPPNAAGHRLMAETIVDYATRNISRLIRT